MALKRPKFDKLKEQCQQDDWDLGKHISSGDYGAVYKTCKSDTGDCGFVLKIQKNDDAFYNEVTMMNKLRHLSVVPKIHAAWVCGDTKHDTILTKVKQLSYLPKDRKRISNLQKKWANTGKGYYVMDLFYELPHYTERTDELFEKVSNALKTLHDEGIGHGDPHDNNIMKKKDGTIVIIDYSFATDFTGVPANQMILTPRGMMTFAEAKIYDELKTLEFFTETNPEEIKISNELKDAYDMEFKRRQFCAQSSNISELKKIANILKLNVPENITKAALCKLIETHTVKKIKTI